MYSKGFGGSVLDRQTNGAEKSLALANLHFSDLLSLRPKSTLQGVFGIFKLQNHIPSLVNLVGEFTALFAFQLQFAAF